MKSSASKHVIHFCCRTHSPETRSSRGWLNDEELCPRSKSAVSHQSWALDFETHSSQCAVLSYWLHVAADDNTHKHIHQDCAFNKIHDFKQKKPNCTWICTGREWFCFQDNYVRGLCMCCRKYRKTCRCIHRVRVRGVKGYERRRNLRERKLTRWRQSRQDWQRRSRREKAKVQQDPQAT